MKHLYLLAALSFLVVLASCEPPASDNPTATAVAPSEQPSLTPTITPPPAPSVSPTPLPTKSPTKTLTPTPVIAPSPTQEDRSDNPTWGFDCYRVERAVNVRAGFSTEFDILDTLQVGNFVLVYDVTQQSGGITWGWVLDDVRGDLIAAGWSAITNGATVWLERTDMENCDA